VLKCFTTKQKMDFFIRPFSILSIFCACIFISIFRSLIKHKLLYSLSLYTKKAVEPLNCRYSVLLASAPSPALSPTAPATSIGSSRLGFSLCYIICEYRRKMKPRFWVGLFLCLFLSKCPCFSELCILFVWNVVRINSFEFKKQG
jgi:hypothetical protein